jgi:hypothetical protein
MSIALHNPGTVMIRSDDGVIAILVTPLILDGAMHCAVHLVLPADGSHPVDISSPRWSPLWSLSAPDGSSVRSMGGGASGGPQLMTMQRSFDLGGRDLDNRDLDGEWTLRILDRGTGRGINGVVRIDTARASIALISARRE